MYAKNYENLLRTDKIIATRVVCIFGPLRRIDSIAGRVVPAAASCPLGLALFEWALADAVMRNAYTLMSCQWTLYRSTLPGRIQDLDLEGERLKQEYRRHVTGIRRVYPLLIEAGYGEGDIAAYSQIFFFNFWVSECTKARRQQLSQLFCALYTKSLACAICINYC